MPVTAIRRTSIAYTVDVVGTHIITAATNTASPGMIEIRTLAVGNTTISVPTGGSTPVACTIVPSSGNTSAITIRGVAGDTGIRIHNTDPTTIALDSSVTSFVINVATADVTGARLYWT